MVEFGLKLEDNKVDEWSDKYIDYEQLKKLIQNAKVAMKTRAELEARRPEEAIIIKNRYLSGNEEDLIRSCNTSSTSLGSLATTNNEFQKNPSELLPPGPPTAPPTPTLSDELKALLLKNAPVDEKSTYGTTEYDSMQSVGGMIKRTMSGIFVRKTYKSKLLDALKEEDAAIASFSNFIHLEAEKVQQFYRDNLLELQKRLEFLEELVSRSNLNLIKKDKKDSHSHLIRHVSRRFTNAFSSALKNHPHFSNIGNTGEGNNEVAQDQKGATNSKEYHDSDDEDDLLGNANSQRLNEIREIESIQRAITDLHRQAKLLSNFGIMNMTGFIKIIKKFNKTIPHCKDSFESILKSNKFLEGSESEALSDRMEMLFANWFCDKNLTEARAKMLPKKGDTLEMDWSQLRLGYRLGMCSILAIWVCWDCVWGLVAEGNSTIGGRTAFPVFRGIGGLIFLHWFWGFSVYIWTRYRINYIFLFDFNPRIVDQPIKIFNDATDETLVFLILMLLYYKSGAKDIPDIVRPGCYPLILVIYACYKLTFPWNQRKPMWRAIGAVVTAPLSSPSFFHTYVADVFTSMVKVFQDLLWTICFFLSGDFLITELDTDEEPHYWQKKVWYKNVAIPLVCLFPLLIRFNQCLRRFADTGKRWPNLANAGKYALSQTVTLFGAFHPLYLLIRSHASAEDGGVAVNDNNISTNNDLFQIFWMGLFLCSSLYSFFWDVYMDWGLGRPKYSFLGPRLMYPKNSNYYWVICIDLVLRMSWVLTLIPPQSGARFAIPNYLSAVTMSLELFRRTIWGFFRLENEHRNNTQGFRRVSFVPLHFSTEHSHKYENTEKQSGWKVIGEVAGVTTLVVAICSASVIAAQRASHLGSGL